MANQNKLKAYVRYDGTGRVIAGGPILQRFKPAVGNWVEINANECCNSIPTTTTTTTQGGDVTPTAWIGRLTTDLLTICESGSNIWYTAGPVIDGHIVYQNADLTNPYTENGIYISTAGYYYQLNEVGLATLIGPCPAPTTTTTTTTSNVVSQAAIGAFSSVDACTGSGAPLTLRFVGPLGNGSALFMDAGLTIPYNPTTYGDYVKLYFNAQDQVCTMSGNIISSYAPC